MADQRQQQGQQPSQQRQRMRVRDDSPTHVTLALVDERGEIKRNHVGVPERAHLRPGDEVPADAHPDDVRSLKKHFELC